MQAGEVKQLRAGLCGGLAFFGDVGCLVLHGLRYCLRLLAAPEAVGFGFGVVSLFPLRVEPFACVFTCLRGKSGVDFKVIAADKSADFGFAPYHNGQRGRLYAAYGGEKKAAIARVKRRHGAGAVDAYEPVCLAAAAGSVSQALHLLGAAQALEAFAHGLRRHALQPQAAHGFAQRLRPARVLLNQAKYQLTLAPRVAGVYQLGNVFALGLFDYGA